MTELAHTSRATLGVYPDAGAIKIYGTSGGIRLPAVAATHTARHLSRNKPPLHIAPAAWAFWAGERAADWGRPVENLDYRPFTGSSELQALLCAGLTRYCQQFGQPAHALSITVGLPLEALTGPEQGTTHLAANVRRWLLGDHAWTADATPYTMTIAEVRIASQPAGALFDFLLDDAGRFIPSRKPLFEREIDVVSVGVVLVGVVSVGMSTVEPLVARGSAPVDRFIAGQTAGVRQLLNLAAPDGWYTLGELEARLRAGQLAMDKALPIWAQEVTGLIERRWGREFRRFTLVLLAGGGALLLRKALLAHFSGKAFMPDDPVLTTARGLYKMALSQATKRQARSPQDADHG